MLVGFSISKVESVRHVPLEELAKLRNVNVNYDINLRNPVVAKGPAGDVLRVDFTFSINYINPSTGYIRFEGFCDRAGGDVGKVKAEWDAGRADPVIQNEIANHMVTRVMPLAMLLSQSLNLPPAMPVPGINFQKPAEFKPPDRFDQTYV